MKKILLIILLGIGFLSAKAQLPNVPPFAVPDMLGTFEDSDVKLLVTENDRDLEGRLDVRSISIIEAPKHGSVEVSDSIVIYTPEPNFFGRDTFNYSIKDIEGNESVLPGIVSVEVIAINDSPVTNNDTAVFQSPETAIAVLNNDFDIDGTIDSSSLELLEEPEHGFVRLDTTTATFYYTAGSDFNGSDVFRYQVRDNDGERTPARVYIISLNAGINDKFNTAIESNIVPNPVTGRSIINFTNPKNNSVQVIITDITGKLVRNLGSTNENFIHFDKASLSPGTYLYLLNSKGAIIGGNKFIIE